MDLLSSGPVAQSAGRAMDDQILEELGSIPAEVKHFFCPLAISNFLTRENAQQTFHGST